MRAEELDTIIYSISTAGEDAVGLMSMLVPSSEGQIASVENTQVRVVAQDGVLLRIEMEGIENRDNLEKLPEFIYELCMQGEYTCEKTDDTYEFKIELDETGIDSLAKSIVPEVASMSLDMDSGTIEVIVKNNEIYMFGIELKGTLDVLPSSVGASVIVECIFNE